MNDPAFWLGLWLLTLSILALGLFGWDKGMAKLGRRRIPEATLLLVCLLGGAAGGLVGMYLFHHKTRKPRFYLTLPLLSLLDAGVFVLGVL